jgi:hypothetical protein
MEVVVTRQNFESILLKDHPCHVCFKLSYWFQRRRFLNIFPIGSYVKTKIFCSHSILSCSLNILFCSHNILSRPLNKLFSSRSKMATSGENHNKLYYSLKILFCSHKKVILFPRERYFVHSIYYFVPITYHLGIEGTICFFSHGLIQQPSFCSTATKFAKLYNGKTTSVRYCHCGSSIVFVHKNS